MEVIFFFFLINFFIGSFLATVVYRIPLSWNNNEQQLKKTIFGLLWPPSCCPLCKQRLQFYEKIPLLSFLILKRKCRYCGKKIHWRYFCIELIAFFALIIVVYRFDDCLQIPAALFFSWMLIVLSAIDVEHYLLPDILTFPFLWAGLVVNAFHIFVSPKSAIFGAIIAYLSLRLFSQAYGCLRKRPVMGQGDFKLFAALGAWLGLESLLNILFLASSLGLLFCLSLWLLRSFDFNKPIPFGPFLAISGFFYLYK